MKIKTILFLFLMLLPKFSFASGNLWTELSNIAKHHWKYYASQNVFYDLSGTTSLNPRKAFEFVIDNRIKAQEKLNITSTPESANWLIGALSLRDAGPFTENYGYMGFRADADILIATKWFVWATPPLEPNDPDPVSKMSFITVLSLDPIQYDDVTPSIAYEYGKILGSYYGPGFNGSWWPNPKKIWFRIQQYQDGALGPVQILSGFVDVEL